MKKFKLTAVATAAAIAMSSLASTSASAGYWWWCCPPCPPKANPSYSSSNGVTVPYVIFGCAAGIIVSAFAANARDNRELTQAEAMSCGLLFWASQPHKHKKHHKHA